MPVMSRLSFRKFFHCARSTVARLRRNETGSVVIYTAVVMTFLIAAVGIGIDTARGFLLKSKLSQALDAAALAGGKTFVIADSNADIVKFFNANFPAGYLDSTVNGPTITQNATTQTISVSATATTNTIFGEVLGVKTMTVSAASQVTRTLTALDVALALDVSGSMGDTLTGASQNKITQVKNAATQLVTTLFGNQATSPTITVNGQTWNLLNIGLVPFNSKVNVLNSFATIPTNIAYDTVTTSFTNPVTGNSQNAVYYANSVSNGTASTRLSYVPLLNTPEAKWKGCVYARYIDDYSGTDGMTNDADLTLDTPTLSGKQWLGWEPIPAAEGEERQGKTSGSQKCYAAAWNSSQTNTTPARPSYWIKANPTNTSDCDVCPAQGITPLQIKSSTITTAIGQLQANGNTNITQGLFWAYQIVMHQSATSVFTQSATNPPFPRQRAIVLLTDGQNVGGNGDSYKGVFGSGANAGTLTNHGTMPSTTYWTGNKPNNLNNRLLQLAAQAKTQGAVRIYVIQFANANDTTTTALLQQVASGTGAPFYFNAPTGSDLQDAFNKITADLSTLRLTQ